MLTVGFGGERGLGRGGWTYVVLFSEFFVEGCAHYYSSDAGWGAEVGFAGLPPRGVEG